MNKMRGAFHGITWLYHLGQEQSLLTKSSCHVLTLQLVLCMREKKRETGAQGGKQVKCWKRLAGAHYFYYKDDSNSEYSLMVKSGQFSSIWAFYGSEK